MDKYDKYEFAGKELTVDNFDNSFRLGYVPDGYYLTEGNYTLSYIMLTYTNGTDDLIFEYGIANDLEPVFIRNVCGFSSIILLQTRQKSAGGLSPGKEF